MLSSIMLPVTNSRMTLNWEMKQRKVGSDTCSSTFLNQKQTSEEITVLADFCGIISI
jgi:hypothetical protein